jgi:thymidylate kinase/thymidylate synthase ThyX
MSSGRGIFIVVEGTDGSGKGTQFKLLADRLEAEGYDVEAFDFPQYEHPSSYFVREYLNGKYGGLDEVGPYTASLFYALDRFEASPRIRQALKDGKVVLANRYVGSSMAHQGTKFQHAEERRGYFIWLDNLEFEMLRIPRPTLSFVLRMPPEIAQSLVDQKGDRQYTDKKRDIHEASLDHLTKAAEVYDDMCQLFPKDFARVDCTRDNQLITIEGIHDILWQRLEPILPSKRKGFKKKAESSASAATAGAPSVTEPAEGHTVLPDPASSTDQADPAEIPAPNVETVQSLDDLVTTMEGDVYALTNKLSSTKAALMIAQLSHRTDGIRQDILHEVHKAPDEMLQVNASTGQLLSSRLVIENCSLLASKKVEWSRLASYVERHTRLLDYAKKDSEGNYRYHTPKELDEKVESQYRAYLDQIFNLYGEMVRMLTDHLKGLSTIPQHHRDEAWEEALRRQAAEVLRGVLPTAAHTDVAIYATGFALESVVTSLLSDELIEAREAGRALLAEARKVLPHFMEDVHAADQAMYKATTEHKVSKLAAQYLPDQYAEPSADVQLVDVWPRNELDLLPEMLYAHTNLPLKDLQRAVQEWPYERKQEIFEAYLGGRNNHAQRPGRALEKIHYSWDLLCDFDTFRDLQRHRNVDSLDWQHLTPRYGYDIPKVVEDADLIDQYEACFELSLRLFSIMQEAGYNTEAQYATLLGHKLRWKLTYNAREAFHLHELRTSPHNRHNVQRLVRVMHQKLSEKHPIIGEAIKFVGQ